MNEPFAAPTNAERILERVNVYTFILASSVLVLLTLIEVIVTSTLGVRQKVDLARRVDHYSRPIFPLAYAAVIAATLLK